MEEPLKILIVDDEPEARELLKYILQEEEEITLSGMAGNVDDALDILERERPDLVFLDIQMPEKDGFHFIEKVSNTGYSPGIVFVTAHENYAIQAIRQSVFDYILKPIHMEELRDAIRRFRASSRMDQQQNLTRLIEALRETSPGKVKLNSRSGYILINPQEVVFCRADGNYTHIRLVNGNEELTTQNLGSIEEMLSSGSFFRVSRSYLVNLKYLSRVDRKSSSCVLEYHGETCSIKIPSAKIRLLEASFS